jgi:hypothetical protein
MLVDYQPMSIDFLVDVSCAKNGVDLLSTVGSQSHVFHEVTEREIAVGADLNGGRTGAGGAAFAFANWPAPGIENG